MKRLAFALLVLSFTSSTFAADGPAKPAEKPAPSLGPRAEKLIKEALPVCSDAATESHIALEHKLPGNMVGAVVGVQPFGGEGLSGTGPKAGGPNYLFRFAVERTLSINTAAAGGNAALLAQDEA